ncbi:MAG: hypothetical protein O3C21_18230 [Verrucomicrobia bacterium]|nr:hypothetical protein [Verrucomicrobiota bacterium]
MMTTMKWMTSLWLTGPIAAVSLCGAIAQDTKQSESDLPKPLDTEIFKTLKDAPPFRRVLSLSDSLVLTGVAKVSTNTVVTVLNTATNESFVVGNEPNAQGWSLVSVEGKGNLRNVVATVDVGNQQVAIRFDPQRLQPELIRRNRRLAAKPGQKPDGEPVQELMKHLDQELLSLFETLNPTKQEEFRQSLADYADAYPDSPDELRASFVRRKLRELRSEAEEDAEN